MSETQIIFKLNGVDGTGPAFGSASRNMEKARSSALNLGRAMEHSVKRVFNEAVGAVGVGAMVQGVRNIIDRSEQQVEMARAVGFTSAQYQALSATAAAAGLSQGELNSRMGEFFDGKRRLDEIITGYLSLSDAIFAASGQTEALGVAMETLSGRTGIKERFQNQFTLGAGGLVALLKSILPGNQAAGARLDYLRMGYGTPTDAEATILAEETSADSLALRQRERAAQQRRKDLDLLAVAKAAGGTGAAFAAFQETSPGRYANLMQLQQDIDAAKGRTLTSEQKTAEAAARIAASMRDAETKAAQQKKDAEKLAQDYLTAEEEMLRQRQRDAVDQARHEKATTDHQAKRQAEFNEAMRKVVSPAWISASGNGYLQAMFGERHAMAGVPVTASGAGPVNDLKTLSRDIREQLSELRKLTSIWGRIGVM
ncbi:MAG: hypothetical protein WCG26_00155 [Chloroflexales bacterium]